MAKSKKAPIRVSAGDALSFNPIGKKGKKKGVNKIFVGGLAVIGLVLSIALIWLFVGLEIQEVLGFKNKQVPVVRAMQGPIKVRPENPGGLQVPNRDKLVYGRIQGGEGEGEGLVERLLPDPETPLQIPVSPPVAPVNNELVAVDDSVLSNVEPLVVDPLAPRQLVPNEHKKVEPEKLIARIDNSIDNPIGNLTVKTVEPVIGGTKENMPEPAIPAPPVAPLASPKIIENPVIMGESSKFIVPPQKPKTKRVAAVTTKIRTQVTIPKGAYQLQLAAARSPDGAKQEWSRLRKKYSDLLGALSLTVMKADLGVTKGIYYRVRVGSYATREAAQSLCSQLVARKAACLVAKSGK